MTQSIPWALPSGARLVVHLYADVAEYAAAMQAAGGPELADNWAATLEGGDCHVVLQPRSDPEVLALADGLPEQTRWLILHESVHQWLRHADAKSRRWWPDWFAEGLCEWVAERSIAAAAPGRASVMTDDRAHLVKDALEHDGFFGLRRLLHVAVQFYVPERAPYAHAWSFVRFLAADTTRFRALAKRIDALPDPPQGAYAVRCVALARAFESALVATYGALDELDAKWRDAVRRETPRWFTPARASEALADGRLLVASFPEGNAILLAASRPPGASYRVTGRFRIVQGPLAQAELYVGYESRDRPRYLKLGLGAGGYVTLMALAGGTWQDRYRLNVDVDPSTFAIGADVPFAMTVEPGRVRLDVRQKTVFDAELPPGYDAARGWWGVGANKSVVVWSDLQVAPAK
jgi:hypothetical protein